MTRQFKKQIQNQSQKGRSMIEMLGVLAIIAILSIGGIVGYKLAMNYYQADQIANEINLMRNDLKVKYALGNEELLLGDPYDDTPENENYSGHLSTQYDRYPVDYDCIRKDKAEFYNCRETDAYYIKVGNISKGVCKPLTTLLNGMDGLMYIEINKEVYKENDLCTSDEVNEFYIQFDAEDVNGNYDSNRPEGWCADDDNCPDEKPFCENERCVECLDDLDCESNMQHCENNECISCPGGKIWSGTACVDCMTDTDCADPDTPICKTDEHICVECTTDEDCLAKGTENPICNKGSNTCEPCPPEKPIWYNNACVECETDEDCLEKGTDKPICNSDTYTCEACPEDQPWNGEFCGCRTNEECMQKLGDGYFCKSSGCYNICKGSDSSTMTEAESCSIYKCEKIADYKVDNKDTDSNSPYILSKSNDLNWWSSDRFCKAQHKQLLTIYKLKCKNKSLGGTTVDYCYAEEGNSGELSEVIKALRKAKSGGDGLSGSGHLWLSDPYTSTNAGGDSCSVYTVNLNNGYLDYDSRSNYYKGYDCSAICGE